MPKSERITITGHVDGADGRRLWGWAYNAAKPRESVTIQAISLPDEVILKEVVADISRDDLFLAEIGMGKHAFDFIVTTRPKDRLLVELREKETGYPIERLTLSPLDDDSTERSSIVGSIDGQDGRRLWGWAADMSNPRTPVSIQAVSIQDNIILSEFKAERVREDLKLAGYGEGAHSFDVALSAYPATTLSVELREKATGQSIGRRTLPPLILADIRGALDGQDQRKLWGWIYDPQNEARHIDVQFVEKHDRTLLGSTVANQYRRDLELAHIGHGDHGFEYVIDTFPEQQLEVDIVEPESGRVIASTQLAEVPGSRSGPSSLTTAYQDLEYKIVEAQLDKDFYLTVFEDIRRSGADPIRHYIDYGWREGRNPSSSFGSREYLTANDLLKHDINPLVHHGINVLSHVAKSGASFDKSAQSRAKPAQRSSRDTSFHALLSESRQSNASIRRFDYLPLDPAKPVVILVVFSQNPTLSDLQKQICRDYIRAGVNLVVSLHQTVPLSPEDAGVPKGVKCVVVRENVGFDFGGWRDCYRQLGDMELFPRVILTNDSLIPVSGDIGAFIERHTHHDSDWLFSTLNHEVARHGQSFFMSFSPSRIGKDIVDYLDSTGFKTKQEIIDNLEVPLMTRLEEAGIATSCLFDDEVYHPDKRELNPTLHSARELVEAGFPFVKAEYLASQLDKGAEWIQTIFAPRRLHQVMRHLETRYPNRPEDRVVVSIPPSGGGKTRGRVILVGHDAQVGGAQRLLLGMAKTMTTVLNYEVVIILLSGGAQLYRFKDVAPTFVLDDIGVDLDRILALAKQQDYTTCILNTVVSLRVLPQIYAYGFKTICLVHEMAETIDILNVGDDVRHALPLLDEVVYPSDVVCGSVEGAYGGGRHNIIVRPQGHYLITRADTDPGDHVESPWLERLGEMKERGERIVICVGTLESRKGFDRFCEIARQCIQSQAFPQAQFVWIGSPQNHCDVQEARDRAVAEGLVTLVPNVQEDVLKQIYALADVYLFTSRRDAMPYAVLDAFYAGLPVIGFAGTGGCDPLIDEMGTLLNDAGDVQTSVDAVVRYLTASTDRDQHRRRIDYIRNKMDFDDYVVELLKAVGHHNPKVDVAVPNYQHERFLPARIGSILAQSYRYFDLYLLDDASKDGSVEVMRTLSRPFSLFTFEEFNQENSGNSYKQWEKAIRALGTSELLWIAESDDSCSQGFLGYMVDTFADEDVVLSFSHTEFIDENGARFGSIQQDFRGIHPFQWDSSYTIAGPDEIKRSLGRANTIINVSSVLFRRSAIPDLGPILRYKFAGDWELYLRMCERGKVAFQRDAINFFRRSRNAQTSRTVYSPLFYEEHNAILNTVAELAGAQAAEQTRETIKLHWRSKPAEGRTLEEFLEIHPR